MRGYSRVQEDLDEYENDELDEYEDIEGDEYGYAQEEEAVVGLEDPVPKKEVQDYLELRQKLKEAARKKLAKQSGSGINARDIKRSKLENFGSFFGPSSPVISERVIQESKSFLETRQELPRVSSSQTDSRKGQVSGMSAPNNGMTERRRPYNPVKTKVQKLKDTRDYSFLLSDDADVPKAANVPPARSNLVAGSAQVPPKSKESGHAGRQIPNGTGQRRPGAANPHIPFGQNSVHQKPSPSTRPDSRRPERSAVPEHKKHYPASGHGNGTGRLAIPKEAPLKRDAPLLKKAQPNHLERKVVGTSTERRAPIVSSVKKPSAAVSKVVSNGQRQHLMKSSVHGVMQQSEERTIRGSKGTFLPKQASSSLRPQAPKQIPHSRYNREDSYRREPQQHRPPPKPKLVRRFPDEEDDGEQAIMEIRKMFGYNPNRYAGDDDDLSDMEADFSTIQMEEKRSEKIAKEEDEREFALIQAEEEREKQRKLAKKRKMGQR